MACFVLVGPPLDAALNPARRKRRPYIKQKLRYAPDLFRSGPSSFSALSAFFVVQP
jgi:hypothetical protein